MFFYKNIMGGGGGGDRLQNGVLQTTMIVVQVDLPKTLANGTFHRDSGGFARGSIKMDRPVANNASKAARKKSL